MSNETQHVESGQSPPAEVRESEARASRIHSLLKLRDKAEAEIASVLREHLDAVGESAWLAWCECEFGWKRRAAYNHLNPEQLQKARDHAEEQRASQSAYRMHIAEPKSLSNLKASPEIVAKWRAAWASLNVTEDEVKEVERASEVLKDLYRILNAAQKRAECVNDFETP